MESVIMLHEWRSSTTQWFKIIFKGAFLYSYDEDWLLPNEYKRSTLSHDKIDSRSILLIPGLHDLSSTFSCFMKAVLLKNSRPGCLVRLQGRNPDNFLFIFWEKR